MQTEAKINKWDHIKLRSFLTSKETMSRIKRHITVWERIIAHHLSDKGLVQIHKALSKQENHKKSIENGKKMG